MLISTLPFCVVWKHLWILGKISKNGRLLGLGDRALRTKIEKKIKWCVMQKESSFLKSQRQANRHNFSCTKEIIELLFMSDWAGQDA